MLPVKVNIISNKFLYDGPDIVSTGQLVNEWTARECETRRIEVTLVAIPIV